MSISAWDHFLGIDWERISQISSKGTCVGCVGVGVMHFVFNQGFGMGLWILLSGLVLAVLEFPGVFIFIPGFDGYREYMLERMLMKQDEVKALMCFLFSILCFRGTALAMLAGLALLLTAIFFGFSAVNKRVDASDRAEAEPGQHSAFVNLHAPMSSNNFNSNASKYQPVPSNSSEGQINPHTGFAAQKQGIVLGSYQNDV